MSRYELKLVDSSRRLADMLAEDIGDDREKFSEIMTLAMRDEYPLSMRAARVAALCIEKQRIPDQDYLPQIIENISRLKVEGVRRSFLKILAEQPVKMDEDTLGKLTDQAFNWLCDTKEAIAVRYYCIDIILKVVSVYPEIGKELAECLKNLFDEESAGLKSKSRKVLKYLAKL
jgi:hypothetical protein